MKQAMIFAAGLGTRLKPLTDTMPKALVRVGGEPLLKRVIEGLRRAGFTRIVVNVHHFSQQIIDYLQANDNLGLDIRVSDETSRLLDTGGGIRMASRLFAPDSAILIHNVDILSNVDLAAFYAFATGKNEGTGEPMPGACLLVSWRKTKRYLLFDGSMRLVGWVNIDTGEVRSPYPEVVEALSRASFPIEVGDVPMRLGDYSMYAFSGIHCFSPHLFSRMEGWPEKFPIMDFYLNQCRDVLIRGYVKTDLHLMDVGKLNTLHDAETFAHDLDTLYRQP